MCFFLFTFLWRVKFDLDYLIFTYKMLLQSLTYSYFNSFRFIFKINTGYFIKNHSFKAEENEWRFKL